MSSEPVPSSQPHRRRFLKNASAVAAAGALGANVLNSRMVHAAGSDLIKYALIGCGGRGLAAAQDAAKAGGGNTRLVALADLFPDKVNYARTTLAQQLGPNNAVAEDKCFTGFDAYKQVMEADCELVLLCTTPHFRPLHLRAAIEAGKHVFCEKPVAVDAPGVRHVLETAKLAEQKKLNLVSGLCWRYDYGVLETMKRIKDGAIGDIMSIQENYLTGTLWHRGRKPEWSEMEYQIRNWLYFTWLSGDHNVEQHIHSLDKAMWLMNDEPPAFCYGTGGRQVRTGEEWGNIYDHFAVVYEWPNGVKCHAYTRQQAECFSETDDFVQGTKGKATVLKYKIEGENPWSYKKNDSDPGMYVAEHIALNKAITAGNLINNGKYMSYSTMLAIMGRMACYTGQKLTWDQAINSKESLTPESYEWGPVKLPESALAVAMPGKTKFV
jgi:myo-inositol 2-dehydrogenase / D-chiro-inositol 1-dehydrogenase